ncbi:unnamed protein product [Notodromas monacha]|uniref:Zinc finger homeobox protein 4 n=1 Tax=Notodromas monacha TaxID=399045 RepID=A0A7R9BE26_9CRUS|nr:unnamed protein product [Notodromas monacha]CAG0912541.1 unnamed protein product [Notodromas monacha]
MESSSIDATTASPVLDASQSSSNTKDTADAHKDSENPSPPTTAGESAELVMSPEGGCSSSPPAAQEGGDACFDVLGAECNMSLLGDVEKFDGKIVYNSDGSAYIIEGTDVPFEDGLPLKQDAIIESPGFSPEKASSQSYPRLASAFFVSRNPFYQALCSQGYFRLMNDKAKVPDAPVVHSYRVYTLCDQGQTKESPGPKGTVQPKRVPAEETSKSALNLEAEYSVPIKPILMCFICKLSFGYVKSFVGHAMADHKLSLNSEEKELLARKNTSAVIQCVGKDRGPLLSFLEPVAPSQDSSLSQTPSEISAQSPGAASVASGHSLHQGTVPSPVINTALASPPLGEKPTEEAEQKPGGIHVRNVTELLNENALHEILQNSGSGNPSQDLGEHAHMLPHCDEATFSDNENKPLFPTSSPGSDSFMSRLSGSSSCSQPSGKSGPPIPSPPRNMVGRLPMPGCPEHFSGKPPGKECSNCDLLMNPQLGSQQLNLMQSRNSCKTLKCPKCNWHYKYQETLEIHMKEKHPDHETTCMYCIMNQQHPRLSRGESYTCGYKPYRCDVCNYSTTTKGNLSIHMQSDKHLNNMQELQQSGGAGIGQSSEMSIPPQPTSRPSPSPPVISSTQKAKPKSTWRCDVCNYETNVARNLRIHMTSEKHTHNLILLQQNVKQMQHLSSLQAQAQAVQAGFDPASLLLQMVPGMNAVNSNSNQGNGTQAGDKAMPQHAEVALADMAYSQALLLQLMASGQLPPPLGSTSNASNTMSGIPGMHGPMTPHVEGDAAPQIPDILDQGDPVEPNPAHMFQCCICAVSSSDNLDALNRHLTADRSKTCEPEVLMLVVGNYVCKLCSYKTTLKANFQLHCKTDKHLQKLQHVNHIREGGPKNDWRLKFLSVNQPVQLRCNACDFYANSTHKLTLHTQGPQHNIGTVLWWHLKQAEEQIPVMNRLYSCSLCNFSSTAKMNLVRHVRSIRHLQMEQLYQMRRRQEGIESPADISLIFLVTDSSENASSDAGNQVPQSIGDQAASPSDDMESLQGDDGGNVSLQQSAKSRMCDQLPDETSECERSCLLSCPLCQDSFTQSEEREHHLSKVHHVKGDAMQRLLAMADWREKFAANNVNVKNESLDDDVDGTPSPSEDQIDQESFEELKCLTCSANFGTIDDLVAHQSELGHLEVRETQHGIGYSCWKPGCTKVFPTTEVLHAHFLDAHKNKQLSVSEKHVYKYRCNQCSLAFKTLEKLQVHSQYHLIREATTCSLCGRTFRSVQALLKHQEVAHADSSEVELLQARAKLLANPLLQPGLSGQVLNPALLELLKSDAAKEDDSEEDTNLSGAEKMEEDTDDAPVTQEQRLLEDYLNSQAIAEEAYNDPNRKYKCHKCRVAYTRQLYLTSHNKTLLHRKGDKLLYPMEKYLDPNRPFKCDICKESFTQKNILLVHYNSVSHLHKLKRVMQDQQVSDLGADRKSPTSPEEQLPSPRSSQLPTLYSGLKSQDEELKPYKCNICHVAYSQGATLDIHIRSVLHQTRASKLQELAMSGQIDLSIPLIEQPELKNEIDPEGKLGKNPEVETSRKIQDILENRRGHENLVDDGTRMEIATDNPEENLGVASGVSKRNGATQEDQSKLEPEVVMQFLEYHQRKDRMKVSGEVAEGKKPNILHAVGDGLTLHEGMKKEETPNLPEINQSTCPICHRTFSSIWVLRAHAEEIHGDFLPLAAVEKFSEDFKTTYRGKATGETSTLRDGERATLDDDRCSIVNPATPKLENQSESALSLKGVSPMPQAHLPGNVGQMPGQSVNNHSVSPGSVPQLNEMNPAALQQMQHLNPMLMASLGLGMPHFGMNMQALAAMNLQPPLVPFMMNAAAQWDPLTAALLSRASQTAGRPGVVPQMDPGFLLNPKLLQQQQQQQQAGAMATTQQKRARTRITDEQLKILRAHFDINNSPSEDQIKEMARQSGLPPKVIKHWFRNTLFKERQRNKDSPYNFNNPPSTSLNIEEYEKSKDDAFGASNPVEPPSHDNTQETLQSVTSGASIENQKPTDIHGTIVKTEGFPHEPSVMMRSPSPCKAEHERQSSSFGDSASPGQNAGQGQSLTIGTPGQNQLNISTPARQHSFQASLNSLLSNAPGVAQSSSVTSFPPFGGSPVPLPPRSDGSLTPTGSSQGFADMSNPSPGTGSSGKRANRTRFTDYQIKVLQEFFENNAYPKDDDLEYLSKLLGLSPRVIVVWFQNARQKARKVYENQPPVDPNDEGAGRFQRTPGLNYQCKKCLLVFQPFPGQQPTPKEEAFQCEHCNVSFPRFDLWQEHQVIHFMNPSLFSLFPGASAASGNPLGSEIRATNLMDSNVVPLRDTPLPNTGHLEHALNQLPIIANQQPSSGAKRKLDESGKDPGAGPGPDQHGKRLRTTILPEQLDYLYQKYQMESNPSRKALETIARDVGLKKRVVQVWFQNTRARERKGQYRAHAQVINKRCPFCPALFRVRSALETHLASKHPDQFSVEDINIDSLPDEETLGNSNASSGDNASRQGNTKLSLSESMQESDLQHFYGNSLRKYLAELESRAAADVNKTEVNLDGAKPGGHAEAPLDLSKPMDLTKAIRGELDEHDDLMGQGCDDTRSETFSESADFLEGDMYNENSSSPSSPLSTSLHGASPSLGNNSSHSASPKSASKRFRTQMSTVQVKVMKAIFEDYKTPTTAECELLGQEIGLPKRVIRVWFQNARAKMKKNWILQQSDGSLTQPNSENAMPEECKLCGVKYSHKYAIQDHLFSHQHIQTVKTFLEEADSQFPSLVMQQTSKSSSGPTNGSGGLGKLGFGSSDQASRMDKPTAEQLLAKLCSGALSGFPLGDVKFPANMSPSVESFASATSAGEWH